MLIGGDPKQSFRVVGTGPDSHGQVWVSIVSLAQPVLFETRLAEQIKVISNG